MRLTVEQNVVIPNVPTAKLDALLQGAPPAHVLPFPGNFLAGLVACTGNQFCGQAIIETKQRALQVWGTVQHSTAF